MVWNGQNGGRPRAFVWEGGTSTQLESLGDSNGALGPNQAFAINDTGQIVGCSGLLLSSSLGGHCETVVMWSGGEIIRLGPSGSFVPSTAINNRGQIIFAPTPTAPAASTPMHSDLPSFPPRIRLGRSVGGRPPRGVASASELGGSMFIA